MTELDGHGSINASQAKISMSKKGKKNGEKTMDLEYEDETPGVQRKEIWEKIDQRPQYLGTTKT